LGVSAVAVVEGGVRETRATGIDERDCVHIHCDGSEKGTRKGGVFGKVVYRSLTFEKPE
jgi:hypothetical protein